MPRAKRIEFAGAWYHVSCRGRQKQSIFNTQKDTAYFFQLIEEISHLFSIEIHGYCLLADQYHLIIHTPKANLSRAMRRLNGLYTQHYNRHHDLDGPLFRSRYQATLIEPNAYLWEACQHIHQLPVEHGLTPDSALYRWSSYRNYLAKSAPPKWLTCRFVQNLMSATTNDWLTAPASKAVQQFYQRKSRHNILASPEYAEQLAATIKNASMQSGLVESPSIAIIAAQVMAHFNIDKSQLLFTQRGQHNLPRMVAMHLCRQLGAHQLGQIADFFQLTSHTTISNQLKACREKLTDQPELEKTIGEIQQRIKNITIVH